MNRREFTLGPLAARVALSTGITQGSWIPTRPRLFYNARDIARLRLPAKSDPKWSKLLTQADQLLTTDFIPESVAERGSGDDASFGRPSQQIANMAFVLGLAFHVTNKEQYAAKLRQAMLHFSAYRAWHGPGFTKREVPWHSELNTARFCVGMGAGYDALYNYLSSSDRQTIAEALVRKGILPSFEDWVSPETRIHALDSMGHNWWAVCVSSAGIAALSLLGDDKRAPDWIDQVDRSMTAWFGYRGNVLQNKSITFDAAGAFYESVNYARYALFEYLRYRLAHANVLPHEKQPEYPPLSKACGFFCQTFYPSSVAPLTVNFGDSSIHLLVSDTVRLLNECGFGSTAAGWYLSKARSASEALDPLELLTRKTIPTSSSPHLPLSVLYGQIGWSVLRSSWNDDATMLAVKSGFTWNHAHADAGSFILFHAGVPLLIDSGTCSYGNPAYTGLLRSKRSSQRCSLQWPR